MDALGVDLLLADMRRSARFSRDAIGRAVEQAATGPDGPPVRATLRRGPALLMLEKVGAFGGAMRDADAPAGQGVRLYAEGDATCDVDRRVRPAVDHGATVVSSPMDRFFGARAFTVRDPDGYQFVLGQPTGTAAVGAIAVLAGANADQAIG